MAYHISCRLVHTEELCMEILSEIPSLPSICLSVYGWLYCAEELHCIMQVDRSECHFLKRRE
jgi:hypothetical protein